MQVNQFFDPTTRRYKKVTASQVCEALRRSARHFGRDNLGFSPEELGTHSIRSGAAMAMYLSRTPVYTIMLIGRWTSDAFLRYIRPQVQDFTRGVSQSMISSHDFFHIPNDTAVKDPRVGWDLPKVHQHGTSFGLPIAARPRFNLH